jgi:hypothetical protein
MYVLLIQANMGRPDVVHFVLLYHRMSNVDTYRTICLSVSTSLGHFHHCIHVVLVVCSDVLSITTDTFFNLNTCETFFRTWQQAFCM